MTREFQFSAVVKQLAETVTQPVECGHTSCTFQVLTFFHSAVVKYGTKMCVIVSQRVLERVLNKE